MVNDTTYRDFLQAIRPAFSKTDKNSQAFRPFFSRSMGISGTILYRFGSRLFAAAALYYGTCILCTHSNYPPLCCWAAFLDLFLMIKGGSFMSADELNIQQYKKMTETPIPKLILGLAAPTILSMLITSIYNLADTIFCGPDLHQRFRCGGHCFQPDGHYSGAWLYTGPRLRHHHQPQPWQPEHRCRHPLCFHQLFLLLWPLAWCWPLWALPLCPAS